MKGKSVLISGVGVAGPSLAYWLDRHGLVPTLVERAPALRQGGYIIDFWGAGYDIAEQMGVLPELLRAGYRVREVRIVDDRGHRSGGFDAALFREAAFGRYTTIARGDLGAVLFRAIDTRVETMFARREFAEAVHTLPPYPALTIVWCHDLDRTAGRSVAEGRARRWRTPRPPHLASARPARPRPGLRR